MLPGERTRSQAGLITPSQYSPTLSKWPGKNITGDRRFPVAQLRAATTVM
jgi:hypothetical protein